MDGLRAWATAEARRRPELEALGYFGSYARGDQGFGSDLDLVAVVAHSPLPFLERARDWKTETLPAPADLLVYTAAEWEALRNGGGRFARVLAAETVWLVRRDPDASAETAGGGTRTDARHRAGFGPLDATRSCVCRPGDRVFDAPERRTRNPSAAATDAADRDTLAWRRDARRSRQPGASATDRGE